MAVKPIERILKWASGGTRVDPGLGKEATGWVLSEQPPHEWENFIRYVMGCWQEYFDLQIDENIVDINTRVLRAGDTMTGPLNFTGIADTTPIMDFLTAAVGDRQLIWQFETSGGDLVKVYAGQTAGLEFVFGDATWDGAAWVVSGTPTRFVLNQGAMVYYVWDGAAWEDGLAYQTFGPSVGQLELQSGPVILESPLATPATPAANALYKTNIPKAHGTVQLTSNPAAYTWSDSFNIVEGSTQVGTAGPGTSAARFVFATGMATTDYTIVAHSGDAGSSPYMRHFVTNRTTADFDIGWRRSDGTTPNWNTDADVVTLSFVVFGDQ